MNAIKPAVMILMTVFIAGCLVQDVEYIDEPVITTSLSVQAYPAGSGEFILNPTPLGQSQYVKDMVVRIDAIASPGWEFVEWVGPVYGPKGSSAYVVMEVSQTVLGIFEEPEAVTTLDSQIPIPTPTLTSASIRSADTQNYSDKIDLTELENIIRNLLPRQPVDSRAIKSKHGNDYTNSNSSSQRRPPTPTPTPVPQPKCTKFMNIPMTIIGRTLGSAVSVWVDDIKLAEQKNVRLNML